MIALSFVVFLSLIFLLGLFSAVKAKKTTEDYYLAGSSVPPLLTALSAVATLNSGYMFTGLIGVAYVAGLNAIWLSIGMFLGDVCASLFSYRQIRRASGATKEVSYAAVLAKWNGSHLPVWRRLAAFMSVIFLCSYAAAQMAAGDKAMQAALDWSPGSGAALTAGLVLLYSTFGGIRASIWTDAAQFVVMLAAMFILFLAGLEAAGGWSSAVYQWQAIPGYLESLDLPAGAPGGLTGPVLFFVGWLVAGFIVIGQPHIMVRYMALESEEKIGQTRIFYYSAYFVFNALVIGVGLLARILLPELGDLDPELSLPTMARALLPAILVGLMLAGVFAAVMSTVDSLVLSSSAAITNDLSPRRFHNPWSPRLATAALTAIALAIATSGTRSVFDLVILSWSVLGAGFAPLLLIHVMNRQIDDRAAVSALVAAVATVIGWRSLGFHSVFSEGAPAILVGLAIAYFGSEKRKTTTT